MSDLPVLPLWVTKYEGKTAHLSLEEDGAYTRLLRLCWRTPGCTIPSDKAWVMRQMRVDLATYERAVKVVLDEFFVCENGRWQSLRLLAEYAAAWEKSQRRKAAGAKGGNAKALNAKETASSNATILPEQCSSKPEPYPQPVVEKEEPKGSSKKTPEPKGSRLPADWRLTPEWLAEAFEALPTDQPLPTEQEIRHEADKFRDHWHAQPGAKGRKLDWLGTWRNWIRRAAPEILQRRARAQRELQYASRSNPTSNAYDQVLRGFAHAAGLEASDNGLRADRHDNRNGSGELFGPAACEVIDRDDPRGTDARFASGDRRAAGATVLPLSRAGGR